MWAVVPLKRFNRAKQRLAAVLDPGERERLAQVMVEDVLGTLCQATELVGILLVSREPAAIAIAERYGTQLFAEPAGADLSESLQAAGGYLMANHDAEATLILPADIPLVQPADIRAVLEQHERLTLVPDAAGDGTNCIVSTPPNLIRYQFDGHSFKPHLDAAYGIGITPHVLRNPNLSLDVDTPADLDALLESDALCRTRTYLEASGIASRPRHPHNGFRVL